MFWLVVYLQSYETYYFVSWDHEITNIWEKTKAMFQTTKQIYCYSNY